MPSGTPMIWPPELSAQAVRLRSERKTFAEIADALGCSLPNVYAHLMSLNGRKKKRRKPAATIKKPKPTVRPCLCCTHPFLSEGPHNRLCQKCRKINANPFAI